MSNPLPPQPRAILVSDFDGTMTRHDFFDLVRQAWPTSPERDPWSLYLAGRITHFEALARIFKGIPGSEERLRELVKRMDLDPELPAALERLREAGWETVVASAGCDWYIRQLFAAVNVELELHTNPGRFVAGQGLIMELPRASRFFLPETGINKVAVVKAALREAGDVAFAGDGRPDLRSALLVPEHRRFARGWLAEELQRTGVPFIPFDRWSDIATHLLAKEASCGRNAK
jgi:2-hydroxy-3-keto-5-methylthiopentenyl-1-phosphate phosphatase